jgi:starch phosphorylase
MTAQALFTSSPPYFYWAYPGQSGLVAYFSMEIAITPAMPTYGGGLGVLAGDTLRAAADLGLALVAVTLAHRKGYFKQRLDENGVQSEEDQPGI